MRLSLRLFLCFMVLPFAVMAQEVTDAQYEAANAAITANATYYVYTLNNGEYESSARYYLTEEGKLTDQVAAAGRFTFRKTEGSSLFKSPGWQFDCFFTNPKVTDNGQGDILNYGYLFTNTRGDYAWEGQVWYKEDDTYAVRATNSIGTAWGANTFWCVEKNYWNYELPTADYSLTPQFTWRLELISAPDPDADPSEKEVQRLTNLPHVYINTFSGRAVTSKTDYVLARMWYVYENDSVAFYDSLEIRGRGNSTWNLAKKPYRLKFHQKEKLLGKGYAKTKKWTMLANHADKTLIRNAVTSAMGERAGLKFNPAAKFVDLTFNDKYVGNYQISDQVDVRPHRVNITEQEYPLTETSDITGGYLFEADGFKDFNSSSYWDSETQTYLPPDGFYTALQSVPVRIHYPDSDELAQEQSDYASNFVQEFENRLFSDDYTDPVNGYRAYVDSTSLLNWYLCTEMSGNVDGMFSTYFYKEQQDNRIFWGPLWDYDIAYNNDNRTDRLGTNDTEKQLMANASYGNVKFWVNRMWSDPWFARNVNRRYQELITGGMEDYLNATIDSLTQLLEASVELNYQRWGISTRVLRERVLYSTYDEYVADLRTYINRHFSFLATTFAELSPEGSDPVDPDPVDPDPVDPDEPKVPDFLADSLLYYAIYNSKTSTYFTADANDQLVCSQRDAEALSQQWRIYPLANGYLYIVNAMNGLALNDPTEGTPTATTLTGTQFNMVAGDSTDVRQQWDLVAQTDERYNLINRFSSHAANLNGGNASDGTQVLSYTSDDRNASSMNRMWLIEEVGQVEPEPEPEPDAIDGASFDYALAYDPTSGRLHFGADDPSNLTFTVRVFDAAGHLLRTFRAADGTSLANLPRGLYIITWTQDGRTRTVKMTR